MATAGQSARAEYQRRRVRDREFIRRRLKYTIPVVLATPIVVYIAVLLGADLLNNLLHHATTSLTKGATTTANTPPVIDHSEAKGIGLVLALAATVALVADFWAPRKSTEAWRIGAEGEERLGAHLDRLTEHGFFVFHDLRVPGSRANVDHLVIGPPGVYVVDAKNYKNPLTWSKDTLWSGRYPLTQKLATVRWEADRVQQRLLNSNIPVGVQSVMCVLGTSLPKPSMLVDGVRLIQGPGALMKGLLRAPEVLNEQALHALRDVVTRSFSPR